MMGRRDAAQNECNRAQQATFLAAGFKRQALGGAQDPVAPAIRAAVAAANARAARGRAEAAHRELLKNEHKF